MLCLDIAHALHDVCVDAQTLDKHNLSIVGTVMAQTVALDHYTVVVDRMLDTFIDINEKIEQSGKFNAGVSCPR